MAAQIADDKKTISEMNEAIKSLADLLPGRIETAVNDIVAANVPSWIDYKQPFIEMSKNLRSSDGGYLEELQNIEQDEKRFLAFSSRAFLEHFQSGGAISDGLVFGKGTDVWFVRGHEKEEVVTEDGDGIQRSYRHDVRGKLVSSWTWHSTFWVCGEINGIKYHIPTEFLTTCPHGGHEYCNCSIGTEVSGEYTHSNAVERILAGGTRLLDYSRTGTIYIPMTAKCYGDNDAIYDTDYYVGKACHPWILNQNYFGKNGTITVALASENQNPWVPILGTAIKGIFSAFNIGGDLSWTPKYTVCIASSKAGYKYLEEDIGNETRAYRISWEDVVWHDEGQSWNLCQSDWDAVLIPVRRAETLAKGKGGVDAEWNGDVGDFLDGYLSQIADPDTMRAGGDGLDVPEHYGDRDLGEEYRFGNKSGFWGGVELATSQDATGNVNAKWQIGNPNQPIKWDDLQKVMFH